MYKHILIPTDGSPLSLKAAEAGITLAKLAGARVTALFAAPAPTPLVYEGFMPVGYLPPDQHAAVIEQAARKYLGAIEKAAQAAGVPCESVHVTSDFPAQAILDTAHSRKCDLIHMASQGRRSVTRLVLGSETLKVLSGSDVPLLIYR